MVVTISLNAVLSLFCNVRGAFGKFKDFCYNLNSNRNWQTRNTPLKYLIRLQPAVKIAMWYTYK